MTPLERTPYLDEGSEIVWSVGSAIGHTTCAAGGPQYGEGGGDQYGYGPGYSYATQAPPGYYRYYFGGS
jgi:hypothetical protein